MRTFIDRCIEQPELIDTDLIDECVENWHHSDISEIMSLHEYLGLTKEEYAQWVTHPEVIRSIVEERAKDGI